MNPKLISVKAIDDFQLELQFTDGEQGIFDVQPYLSYPVYQPLSDLQLFRSAHIVFDFVAWDNDIDMSPDTLYLECVINATINT